MMRRDSYAIILLLFIHIGIAATLDLGRAKKNNDLENEIEEMIDELNSLQEYKARYAKNLPQGNNGQENLNLNDLNDQVKKQKGGSAPPPPPEKDDLGPEKGIPKQNPAKEKETANGKKKQSQQSSNSQWGASSSNKKKRDASFWKYIKKIKVPKTKRRNYKVKSHDHYSESVSKNSHEKRASSDWPYSEGINMANIASTLPSGAVRTGEATDTDTCLNIRKVPKAIRSSSAMYKNGIDVTYYTKYTETYGIPIIGSSDVTDEGLSRACYVIKMMLASRYDVRNAIYKLYGRIALIGDNEEQNTLIDYRHLDNSWNSRVRGLGPTLSIPISSAGDDNMRCKATERYWDQDILVHEFSHHVDVIGATYTIAGFKKRLSDIFNEQVNEKGLWAGEYAATNRHEYFATAAQFYFNAFQYPGNYKNKYNVFDQASLRSYDSKITELLDEVHPCFAYEGNSLIHRCDYKRCTKDNYVLVFDDSVKAMSGCPVIEETYSVASLDACADMACHYGANVFNFKGSRCYVLKCPHTNDYAGMNLTQSAGDYNIYKINGNLPVMDNSAESSQTFTSHCLNGPQGTARCNVAADDRTTCGWMNITKKWCKRIGCCWANEECFYSNQECYDSHYLCSERAKAGDCTTNPGYMYRKCSLSCGICDKLNQVTEEQLLGLCQDKNIYCADWANNEECTKNPAWMSSTCQISCNVCNSPANPIS